MVVMEGLDDRRSDLPGADQEDAHGREAYSCRLSTTPVGYRGPVRAVPMLVAVVLGGVLVTLAGSARPQRRRFAGPSSRAGSTRRSRSCPPRASLGACTSSSSAGRSASSSAEGSVPGSSSTSGTSSSRWRAGAPRPRVRPELREEPARVRELHEPERGHESRRYRTNGRTARAASARILLRVDQPYSNHNGGNIVFGPDGGSTSVSATAARAATPRSGRRTCAPCSGRCCASTCAAGLGSEIVGLGLRNPWRYSFDRQTGDLYIGDVGQGAVEEVDFTPRESPGLENYGWDVYEGSGASRGEPGPGQLVFPVFEYGRGSGNCTVIGGFVYRRSARRRSAAATSSATTAAASSGASGALRGADGAAQGAVPSRAHVVRRGRRRRAVRRRSGRHAVPASPEPFT